MLAKHYFMMKGGERFFFVQTILFIKTLSIVIIFQIYLYSVCIVESCSSFKETESWQNIRLYWRML